MTSTLPPLVQAFSAAIGSAAANATSYPLDLVTTRLQTTTSKSPRMRGLPGALNLIRQIATRHGWDALYDGLATDTAAQVVSSFLYYYFYSWLRNLFLRRKSRGSAAVKGAQALGVLEELALGYVAGLASRAISTPLSVITVTIQTEREDAEHDEESSSSHGSEKGDEKEGEKAGTLSGVIGRIRVEHGVLGFWRGFPSAIPLALTPALTLLLFQLFRRLLPRAHRERPRAGEAFVGGALAQSIATTILYPLMLAKTRIQTARSTSSPSDPKSQPTVWTVWQRALARDGPMGLYQGLEAQVAKGVVSQGLTMLLKSRVEMAIVGVYLWRQGATR